MLTICMPIGQQPPALAALSVITSLSAAARQTAPLATPRALCRPCTVRAQQRRRHLVGGQVRGDSCTHSANCSRQGPEAGALGKGRMAPPTRVAIRQQSGSTAGGEACSIAGFLWLLTQPWRTRHGRWLLWRELFTLRKGSCATRNTAAQGFHNWRSAPRTRTRLPQHRTFALAPRLSFTYQVTPHSDGLLVLLPQSGWCSSTLEPGQP
jgi:hypothetical protein